MSDEQQNLSVETRGGRQQRWEMIRDLLVFQGKLFLDGLRDLILAPAALVTGILAIIAPNAKSENLFFDVLHLGTRLDKWINLFGALKRRQQREQRGIDAADPESIDVPLDKIEALIKRLHARGGVTRQAKDRIDELLDTIQVTDRDKRD